MDMTFYCVVIELYIECMYARSLCLITCIYQNMNAFSTLREKSRTSN